MKTSIWYYKFQETDLIFELRDLLPKPQTPFIALILLQMIFNSSKIDGDYLYSSETDEDDLPYLIKYEIIK